MPKQEMTFAQVHNTCVICTTQIPIARVKMFAVTCSKECFKAWRKQRALLTEQTECKYCRRPSNPQQRDAFKRFRRIEKTKPYLLYPEEFEQFKQIPSDPSRFKTEEESFTAHWNSNK